MGATVVGAVALVDVNEEGDAWWLWGAGVLETTWLYGVALFVVGMVFCTLVDTYCTDR